MSKSSAMRFMRRALAGSAAALLFGSFGVISPAQAAAISPNIATGTPTVDRYPADSFGNIGTFEGRQNVLGITIGPNGEQPNRPTGYSSTFYDYQGSSYSLGGAPASDLLTMDLWVPSSWSNPANGAVNAGMWGVMTDNSNNITGYPIIAFTNNDLTDSFVGFEVWDDQNGVWDPLTGVAFNSDAWNTLAFDFNSSTDKYDYYVNGALVASIAGDPTTTKYSAVIFDSLNYGDPNRTSSNGQPVVATYDVRWATPVPEPASLALFGTALAGLGVVRRRRGQSGKSA